MRGLRRSVGRARSGNLQRRRRRGSNRLRNVQKLQRRREREWWPGEYKCGQPMLRDKLNCVFQCHLRMKHENFHLTTTNEPSPRNRVRTQSVNTASNGKSRGRGIASSDGYACSEARRDLSMEQCRY